MNTVSKGGETVEDSNEMEEQATGIGVGGRPVSRENVIKYLVEEYTMLQEDAEHYCTKWAQRIEVGAQLNSMTYYVGDEIFKLAQTEKP